MPVAPPHFRADRTRAFPKVMAGALILALLATLISKHLEGQPLARDFDLGLPALLFLLTIPFALRRAAAEPAEAAGWRLMGIALMLMGLGALLRLAVMLELGPIQPMTNIALLIQLAGGLFQVPALLSWPLAPRGGRERFRKALDALVFTLSLFFILWILGWGGMFAASTEPMTRKLFTLAFPLSSILTMGIGIYLGANHPSHPFKGPLGWITLSLLMAFLGNLSWAFLSLKGINSQDFFIVDFFQFSIPLAKALATQSPRPVGNTPERSEAQDRSGLSSALPYLPVLPALVLGMVSLLRGTRDWGPVLPWVGAAMMIILVIRQFLALWDLRRFSSTLEQRVQERTEALEQSQGLMIRTQRMNTLASMGAGLAHDLNNLLNASRLSINLVEADLEDGLPPQVKDLERAKQTLDRAADLTHQLLAFGREGGPAVPFDLGERTRASEPLLNVLLPKTITLRFKTDTAPLPLLGHPTQLDQILVNLVTNARDAMPHGGQITLRTRRAGTGMAELEVEDTGQGMSPEIQAKVFEAFFTTKPPGKGTGLGLASVRALVAQAGGDIQLWSEEGQGTKFVLSWATT